MDQVISQPWNREPLLRRTLLLLLFILRNLPNFDSHHVLIFACDTDVLFCCVLEFIDIFICKGSSSRSSVPLFLGVCLATENRFSSHLQRRRKYFSFSERFLYYFIITLFSNPSFPRAKLDRFPVVASKLYTFVSLLLRPFRFFTLCTGIRNIFYSFNNEEQSFRPFLHCLVSL